MLDLCPHCGHDTNEIYRLRGKLWVLAEELRLVRKAIVIQGAIEVGAIRPIPSPHEAEKMDVTAVSKEWLANMLCIVQGQARQAETAASELNELLRKKEEELQAEHAAHLIDVAELKDKYYIACGKLAALQEKYSEHDEASHQP